MSSKKLIEQVKQLPRVPGVYIYKDEKGKIIYIGKAKDLKSRVSSYFQDNLQLGTKTYALVQNIDTFSYIEALSELDALILEAALIKKHKPKYNIALKDDKSYLYLVIRNEVVTIQGDQVKLPKVIAARESDLLKSDTRFGPYPHGDIARQMARVIRKSLPYRDCSLSKFNKYHKLNSPCLYGHIGLCQAPCTTRISVEDYIKEINQIKKLLSGESKKLLNEAEKKMKTAAKHQKYEEAAQYRDVLSKFNYLRKSFKSANTYIDNPYLVEDSIKLSLASLCDTVPALNTLPHRIECYDISTFSGKDSVGSLVVATDGRVDKSQYRRYKVESLDNPDDFYMMYEMLSRRFSLERLDGSSKDMIPFPDLVVLDGGKGQVSVISNLFEERNIKIPLIGLAKRFETIVYKQDNDFIEVRLARNNEGLKLLQRLRDEAHRFAQAYHHKLSLDKIINS